MTSYKVTAESNYPAGFELVNYCFTDKQFIGSAFDRVRRNIMYAVAITDKEYAGNQITETNDTGQTLWSGLDLYPPGNNINLQTTFTYRTAIKNIDTGVVTFYDPYDPAQLVPEGIGGGGIAAFTITPGIGATDGTTQGRAAVGGSGHNATATLTFTGGALTLATFWNVGFDYQVGDTLTFAIPGWTGHITVDEVIPSSDGTWGRCVADTHLHGGDVISICDPRTGNFWIHLQSCELQVFRPETNYCMEISPLQLPFTIAQNVDADAEPLGVTADWVYYKGWRSNTVVKLQILPSSITPDERTADYLQATYTYDYPAANVKLRYRALVGTDGNLYLFGAYQDSPIKYKLYKCVPGVGFTDITPWGATTGPNTVVAGWGGNYFYSPIGGSMRSNTYLFKLPATNELVLLSKLGDADATKFRVDCTYCGMGGGFDYHQAFVSRYMTADWVPTDEAGGVWYVKDFNEFDNDLEASDYLHNVDYSVRRFMFICEYMAATGDDVGNNVCVFVEYKFVNGAPPVVRQVIPERDFDNLYPAYQELIGQPEIIAGSLPALAKAPVSYGLAELAIDNGIWDRATDDMWLSGDEPNFCKFNDSFIGQYTPCFEGWDTGFQSVGSPFLRISVGGSVPLDTVLNPKDLIVPDCEADSRTIPIAPGRWSLDTPTNVVEGLWHLEGERVSILADGQVVEQQVVENGRVTLPANATRAAVGLQYVICATTLPVTTQQAVIEGRRKIVPAINVRVDKTGGVKLGRDTRNLYDMRRKIGNLSPDMLTGITHTVLSTNWEDDGQVHFRQEDPLPITLLSLMLEVDVGDDPS
jgi:hypothetical protein